MKTVVLKCCLLLSLAAPLAAQPAVRNGDLDYPNIGVAKQRIREYVRGGRYAEEMNRVATAARTYLEANLAGVERPALVLDIDETSISNWEIVDKLDFGYVAADWDHWIDEAKAPALTGTLELYRWARAHNVACFFVTARDEGERASTEKNLRNAGYEGWQQLFLLQGPRPPSSASFKSACRKEIEAKGYHIVVNMGDQYSDLEGGYAEGQFKLPNPMYFVP